MLALLLMVLFSAGFGPHAKAEEADALAAYDAGDYVEAARIWQQRAAAGDAAAKVSLAGLYEVGLGVPLDRQHALALYREAAAAGDATARRLLCSRHLGPCR